MSADNNRRDFLKKMVIAVPATLIAQRLLFSSSTALAADLPMVSEKDPQAVGLGYQSDASKVDIKKFPKRAGEEGKKQLCSGCMFYQGGADPLKTKAAPCQLFPGKQVSAKGWCNSWAKNAKLK